ncbi:hypothetical protein [Brachybacterium avium]|uniref:hypothetical protein n=1 Tax=Brachybacterium avium TaxID=2017485 RepID=UPI001FE3F6E9|nr:hypothetical protein [Brachybacterium avium]
MAVVCSIDGDVSAAGASVFSVPVLLDPVVGGCGVFVAGAFGAEVFSAGVVLAGEVFAGVFFAGVFFAAVLVVDALLSDVVVESFAADAADRLDPLLAAGLFEARVPVAGDGAGSAAGVFCVLWLADRSETAPVPEVRRPVVLPERPRRSAAARAIPVARSRAPARSR